jgi:cell division septation protein DedD
VPAARPATAPSVRATGGPWKVQLGAFSVAGNADRLWARLASRPELSGAKKLTVPSGRVTRLLAGGYASKAAADSACRALKTSGQDCIVTSD